jgi:hypothetical protein
LVCIYAGVIPVVTFDSRKQEKLFQRQKSAIEDILSEGGVSQVLEFASTVSKAETDAYLGELGFLEPVDSLFLPLEAENHSPMTTQLS